MTSDPPQTHRTVLWFNSGAGNLQTKKMSDKVCMMYKIMNGLVKVNPAALLSPETADPGDTNTNPKPQLEN